MKKAFQIFYFVALFFCCVACETSLAPENQETNPITDPNSNERPVDSVAPIEDPDSKSTDSPVQENPEQSDVKEPDVVPPVVDTSCGSGFLKQSVIDSTEITFNPTYALPSQEIEVSWKIPDQGVQPTAVINYWGQKISTELEGSAKIVYYGDSSLQIKVVACGKGFVFYKKIPTASFKKIPEVFLASLVSKKSQNGFWGGGQAGFLYESVNGEDWVKVGDARTVKKSKETFQNTSPINALWDAGDDCDGALYFGSQAGYVYRSLDQGKSLSGLNGGDSPVGYLTSNPSDPIKNPSAIQFIIGDPTDSHKFYVGHASGLIHFDDCQNPDAKSASYLFAHKNVSRAAVLENRLFVIVDNQLQSTVDGSTWITHDLKSPVHWIKSGAILLVGTENSIQVYHSGHWYVVSRQPSRDGIGISDDLVFLTLEVGIEYLTPVSQSLFENVDESIVKFYHDDVSQMVWAISDNGSVYLLEYEGDL